MTRTDILRELWYLLALCNGQLIKPDPRIREGVVELIKNVTLDNLEEPQAPL